MIKIDNFNYTNVNKIYTLSDIHGDIDGLIIALRDCAQVIDCYDFDLFTHCLSQDLSVNDDGYNDSMGFRWCGGDAFVVIIGDILDNARKTKPGKMGSLIIEGRRDGEYLNEEVKILRLLNKLSQEAFDNNGRIIKLLGNHELKNMDTTDKKFVDNYNSEFTIRQKYLGYNRKTLFTSGNIGINLLKNEHEDNNCGFIAKINDYLFVHGGLTTHIFNIDNTNDINNLITKINIYAKSIANNSAVSNDRHVEYRYISRDPFKKYYKNSNEYKLISRPTLVPSTIGTKNASGKWINDENGGIVWTRFLSDISLIDTNENKLCENLYTILNEFTNKNLKLVIGHCPQSQSVSDDVIIINAKSENYGFALKNRTYNKNSNDNKRHIIYSDPSGTIGETDPLTYRGLPTSKHIFGMTLGCSHKSIGDTILNSDYKIYRVDVGFSRAFDFGNASKFFVDPSNNDYIKYFLRSLYSRSPSVLSIDMNNTDGTYVYTTKIIRSSLENTLKNQKRTFIKKGNCVTDCTIDLVKDYLDLIKSVDNEVFEEPIYNYRQFEPIGGLSDYHKKYMKYKLKYMKLKELLNIKN